jgi:chemotaxis protein CheX
LSAAGSSPDDATSPSVDESEPVGADIKTSAHADRGANRNKRLPDSKPLSNSARVGGVQQGLVGAVMAGNANRSRKSLAFWTEVDVKTPKRSPSRQRRRKVAEARDAETEQVSVATPSATLSADVLETEMEQERGPAPPPPRPGGAPDLILPLPATLDLAAAGELARALLARRGQIVVIDAAAVLHVSAPCAQVLMSAAATWLADDASFSIANCGDKMMEDLSVLGIATSTLNIEATAP